jgi:hypothetical protein
MFQFFLVGFQHLVTAWMGFRRQNFEIIYICLFYNECLLTFIYFFFFFVGLRIFWRLDWISKVISSKFFLLFFYRNVLLTFWFSFFCRFMDFWTLIRRNFKGNLRNLYFIFQRNDTNVSSFSFVGFRLSIVEIKTVSFATICET